MIKKPTSAPLNPPFQIQLNASLENRWEPSFNGIYSLFGHWGLRGTIEDKSWLTLADFWLTKSPPHKATHLTTHLNPRMTWGHLPPSKSPFFVLILAPARDGRMLTTRPQRAGGQHPDRAQDDPKQAQKTGEENLRAADFLLKNKQRRKGNGY